MKIPIVHLTRFFENASKHYITSLSIHGVPNGLSGWKKDIAIRVKQLLQKYFTKLHKI